MPQHRHKTRPSKLGTSQSIFFKHLEKRDNFIANRSSPFYSPIKISPQNTLLAVCFFLLISSAYAINTQNQMQSNTNLKKLPFKEPDEEQKQLIVQEVCMRKNPTSNKPTEFALGVNLLGELIPLSCVLMDETRCQEERSLYESFEPRFDAVGAIRKKQDKIYTTWKTTTLDQMIPLVDVLDENDSYSFRHIMHMVFNLKHEHLLANEAKKSTEGNCAEHARMALMDLIKRKQTHHLNLKIQLVSLTSKTTDGHEFLLLDSNMPDGIIKNDKAALNQFWSTAEGMICDPWNHGTLVDLKDDKTNLYGSFTNWDSINIKTYHVNFNGFAQLPLEHQQFICKQLSKMNLGLEPENLCTSLKI